MMEHKPIKQELKKSSKKVLKINTVGLDPNGLPKRICKECDKVISYEDKALKSVMRINDWVCIPCFEIKLGRKLDKEIEK